jgi:hypothetical protein
MCDPGTLGLMAASAGLSAGGAAIQRSEADANANSIASARNGVLQQYLDRQRKLGEEGRGYFDTRMQDYAPGKQAEALDKAQADRTEGILKNVSAPNVDAVPLTGSTPQVVKSEIAKRMLATFQQATDRAKAAGKLSGYGDSWLGNNLGVADTARRVGTVNNFSQNEAALLPNEQQFAEVAARKQPSIWGPILSAGGNLVASAAGRGANPFGTA